MERKQSRAAVWLRWFVFSMCVNTLFLPSAMATSLQFGGLTFGFSNTGTYLTNTSADGSAVVTDNGTLLTIVGPNNGDGYPGATNLTAIAASTESITFQWSYASDDTPGFDAGGYLLGTTFVQLADTDGESGSMHISLSPGEMFGFSVTSVDNEGEPGILTISALQVAGSGPTNVPEPSIFPMLLGISFCLIVYRKVAVLRLARLRSVSMAIFGILLCLCVRVSGVAATQTNYGGSNATGLLKLTTTVNMMQVARVDAGDSPSMSAEVTRRTRAAVAQLRNLPEFPKVLPHHAHPIARRSGLLALLAEQQFSVSRNLSTVPVIDLIVESGGGRSFNGLTQLDQRDADQGNQFTIEPANPSIAVADNYVLEGVNNAIQVYDNSGNPRLPTPISSNELFGLAPAYDRSTQIYGPYPTDMRVFYDRDVERWFVLQRAQDNDMFGDELESSHLYLAVSKTADPTADYNIYVADTTDLSNSLCPCFDDYPQIGADRYGFYISSNQLNSDSQEFADATILALSKVSLATGDATPTTFLFTLPLVTGYEFAVQPATTPAGASYLLANNGLEYFASTVYDSAGDSVAVWAMSNTSSLDSANPSPSLVETVVTTLSYSTPPPATQPDGDRPYGMTYYPQAPLPLLDGGDTRALSLSYSGARLYLTFSTSALDPNNLNVVGGALVILSPTFRNRVLNASVLQQSYLVVPGNSLLRASIAVNANGVGDIAATVVGSHLYPSAAFIPVSIFSSPKDLFIAGRGTLPEDGFTGYGQYGDIARWGDFSTAVAASDGSIWTASEYIGNLPRTVGANWDTYITHVTP